MREPAASNTRGKARIDLHTSLCPPHVRHGTCTPALTRAHVQINKMSRMCGEVYLQRRSTHGTVPGGGRPALDVAGPLRETSAWDEKKLEEDGAGVRASPFRAKHVCECATICQQFSNSPSLSMWTQHQCLARELQGFLSTLGLLRHPASWTDRHLFLGLFSKQPFWGYPAPSQGPVRDVK